MNSLIQVIDLVFTLAYVVILARIILSFVIPLLGNRPHPLVTQAAGVVNQITEPLLGPIRRVLPTFGRMDFSPIVAIIMLQGIRWLVVRVLS